MIERAFVEYVANSIWQVPMVAAIAWLLIRVGKPGARIQQNVWLLALALCVLLPLLKQAEFTPRPASPDSGMRFAEIQPVQDLAPAARRKSASASVLAAVDRESWRPHVLVLSQIAVDWLLGIYLAIAFSRLIQLAFAWRAARKLVAHAIERKMSASEQADLKRFCGRLNLPEPRVLVSSQIASPMNIGFLRPALLLPEAVHENTESEMAAILCHELAHISRRDYLANWICQLGSLPIAYHPATHVLNRRIRQTRELVCDRMAADAICSATGYARCLLTLAQRMVEEGSVAQRVQAPGLFDHDVLEERIMQLLKRKNTTSPRVKTLWIASGTALTAAMIVVAISFHLSPTIVHAAEATAQSATPSVSNVQSTAAQLPQIAPAPELTVAAGPIIPLRAVVPVNVKLSHRAKKNLAMPVAIPVPAIIALQATPASPAPVSSISPDRLLSSTPSRPAHPQATARHPKIPQNGQIGMTPEQRARVEQKIDEANAQIQQATKRLQSPEFKKQMADMQLQIAEATKEMRSDAAQQQLKMLQSEKFQKQMADIQVQIAEATKEMRSDAGQQQLKMLQSREFKKQMADMQLQVAEAKKEMRSDAAQHQLEMVQSPEFKKQMADMQRKVAEAAKRFDEDSRRIGRKDTPLPNASSARSNKKDSNIR